MLKGIHPRVKEKPKSPLTIIIILFLALFTFVVFYRIYAAIALRQQTRADDINIVNVITATPVQGYETIILPGNVQAWHDAIIYA